MIETRRQERVEHLVINVPPVNVFGAGALRELALALRRCACEDGIAAVLLSGEGRCFSAGASVAEHKADQAEAMLGALVDVCVALEELPVPAVALVHGSCLGGAMEVVSFCDFVVADPGATFGQPEIKLAFFPPVACSQLPRLAGLQNAAYAILSGETLSAERAAAMGVVQKILPREDWGQVAALFNGLSAAALRVAKEGLILGAGATRREQLEKLKQLFLSRLYRLEDVEEGIRSFEEKRRPEWKHR